MHSELKALLYEAEDHYLSQKEINLFQQNITSLQQRLETYQQISNQEIDIFQPIADQLLEAFPVEEEKTLELSLGHWLTIMRYCAMAMLSNNSQFLERRLLEWLTDIMQVQQTQVIDRKIGQLLQKQLQNLLSKEQLALLQPFLNQAERTLFANKALV